METESSYWLIWLIYIAAAVLFLNIFWRITRLQGWPWLRFSLRGLMLALIFTPWYANIEGTNLAPALMIVALDAITVGMSAAPRALVPLLLALVAAEVLATILFFAERRKRKAINTGS
jgi:hypothetical protein